MRHEEYCLLLAACQKTAKNQPNLQESQEESAEKSANSINEEIEGFLGEIFRSREKTREIASDLMQPMLMAFDLGLLQICDLAYFSWKNNENDVKIIWPDADLPTRPTPTKVFYILASNLAQSLQAVRTLLLGGFEGQSRAMFRSFVELADLFLAVIADEDIYRRYITVHQDEKERYNHWRKYLSPKLIRQRLAKLDVELELTKTTSIPSHEVREDTYQWFSLFSHNDMVAHLVSAFPQRLNEESVSPIAMLGETGEMTSSTFSRILLYLWLFFINFDSLLWEKHKWNRFRGSHWRGRYRYRSQVFDTLFRENYDQLQGIIRNEKDYEK